MQNSEDDKEVLKGLTRRCPAHDCMNEIKEGHVCCIKHWKLVPRNYQSAVSINEPGSELHKQARIKIIKYLRKYT